MLRFDGKVAIVTGGGRGLGREYALLLGRRGARVVVNDLGEVTGWFVKGEKTKRENVAERVAAEIRDAGGVAIANADSVTEGEKVVQAALDAFGRVDILICNAGTAHAAPFQAVRLADWEQQMSVHAGGSFAVCRAAWPHMLRQRYGRVVLTTSPAGLYGIASAGPYSAAKAAVIGLANILTLEGRRHGIRVNCIAPYAATRLTSAVVPRDQERARVSFGRQMAPAFVAGLVACLCHEGCPESGGVFEAGGGWYSKVRLQRSRGLVLPASGDGATPEWIRESWGRLTDFADAEDVGPGSTADVPARVARAPAKL